MKLVSSFQICMIILFLNTGMLKQSMSFFFFCLRSAKWTTPTEVLIFIIQFDFEIIWVYYIFINLYCCQNFHDPHFQLCIWMHGHDRHFKKLYMNSSICTTLFWHSEQTDVIVITILYINTFNFKTASLRWKYSSVE